MLLKVVCLAAVGLVAVPGLGAPLGLQRTRALDAYDTLQIRGDYTFVKRAIINDEASLEHPRKPGCFVTPATCPFSCTTTTLAHATAARIIGHIIARHRGLEPEWEPPATKPFCSDIRRKYPPGETSRSMTELVAIVKANRESAKTFRQQCLLRIERSAAGHAGPSMGQATLTSESHRAVHSGVLTPCAHSVETPTSEHLRAVQFGATCTPDLAQVRDANRASSSAQHTAFIPGQPRQAPNSRPSQRPHTDDPEDMWGQYLKPWLMSHGLAVDPQPRYQW